MIILALIGLMTAGPAAARLSPAQLATVGVAPSRGAALPQDALLTDTSATTKPLQAWLGGRPALLMLADYRCTQVCGPMLSIAAGALEASGLAVDRDFRLLLLDFNPRAGGEDGEAMRAAQLGAFPDLDGSARFLTGTPDTLSRIEHALGFAAVYDETAGRYAHPTDLFVLTADGRVSRVLNGLSLDETTVRLALVEAGQGRIGSLVDRLHVLCYGLDPLSGASNGAVLLLLRIGAALTLAGVGILVVLTIRRRTVLGRGQA